MANQNHVNILKSEVENWNKCRMKNANFTFSPNLMNADLNGADLSGAELIIANLEGAELRNARLARANLIGANLYQADLSGAILSEANFTEANLSGANLSGVDLGDANLKKANLRKANLRNAHLGGANLYRADLSGADLSNAKFGSTILAHCNLSHIKGLDEIVHRRESSIGVETFTMSDGKLSEKFLRGCGLSDLDIEYAKLHIPHLTHEEITNITYKINALRINQPIQFYACFISYSARNVDFATKLHNDLQGKGVRCWFAPEDIKGGKKIRSQIDGAIRIYDKLILILSEHSMNSKWVAHEIKQARKQEAGKGIQMLFPISLVDFEKIKEWTLFDDDDVSNLAAEVKSYFIPDFSEWENRGNYKKSFDRLLKDLRAENKVPS